MSVSCPEGTLISFEPQFKAHSDLLLSYVWRQLSSSSLQILSSLLSWDEYTLLFIIFLYPDPIYLSSLVCLSLTPMRPLSSFPTAQSFFSVSLHIMFFLPGVFFPSHSPSLMLNSFLFTIWTQGKGSLRKNLPNPTWVLKGQSMCSGLSPSRQCIQSLLEKRDIFCSKQNVSSL